jgi:Filamin/ABP280 repeat
LYFQGPGTTHTGDFYITGVYQSNGLYLAQYVPQVAGKYTLSITLLDVHIKGSPFTVDIVPGEVSPSNCITSLGLAPLTAKAGSTKFFTITTYDLFNNLEVQSYADTEIEILAKYVDHNAYLSPINVPDLPTWQFNYGKDITGLALDRFDGTYASQLTIYRAGTYALSIKVNEVHVKQSPYQMPESDYLYITPSEIYAPNCIVKQVVLDYVAGTTSGFDIQGRDFYSNNIIVGMTASITDNKVDFRDV